MRQCWNDEPIKIVMYFDNGLTYETQTHSLSNNSIVSFVKRKSEQTNFTNLFGSVTSTEISVKLFDVLDRLNIQNSGSPYYNYMGQGVEIKTYISYDNGTSWENYGTYYVSSWSGSFNNGFQDIVQIDAVDEMRYILNNDIPKLSTYSGIKAGELIKKVLVGIGIDAERIKIDKSLDTKLLFGVAEDQKVGYFLNDICQALCAVIIINDDNDILVMPALVGYGKEYNIGKECIEQVNNSNNNRNIYTYVKCKYNKRKGTQNGSILYDKVELKTGVNDFNNLKFSAKALNVREIRVESDNSIGFGGFTAYQDGIDIDLKSEVSEDDVDITVSGEYITSVEKYEISELNYTDKKNDTRKVSYEMYNQYIQTSEEAKAICDKMARYIELNNRLIIMKTILSPMITVGDILNFDNNLLKGKYKVIEDRVVLGTEYTKILTLIPYDILAVWEDDKVWDDDAMWIENISLPFK